MPMPKNDSAVVFSQTLIQNGLHDVVKEALTDHPNLSGDELKAELQKQLDYHSYYHKEDTRAMERSLTEGLPIFDD